MKLDVMLWLGLSVVAVTYLHFGSCQNDATSSSSPSVRLRQCMNTCLSHEVDGAHPYSEPDTTFETSKMCDVDEGLYSGISRTIKTWHVCYNANVKLQKLRQPSIEMCVTRDPLALEKTLFKVEEEENGEGGIAEDEEGSSLPALASPTSATTSNYSFVIDNLATCGCNLPGEDLNELPSSTSGHHTTEALTSEELSSLSHCYYRDIASRIWSHGGCKVVCRARTHVRCECDTEELLKAGGFSLEALEKIATPSSTSSSSEQDSNPNLGDVSTTYSNSEAETSPPFIIYISDTPRIWDVPVTCDDTCKRKQEAMQTVALWVALVIVFICVGTGSFILLLAGVTWCCRKRRRRLLLEEEQQQQHLKVNEDKGSENTVDSFPPELTLGHTAAHLRDCLRPPYDTLTRETSEVTSREVLQREQQEEDDDLDGPFEDHTIDSFSREVSGENPLQQHPTVSKGFSSVFRLCDTSTDESPSNITTLQP